MKTNYTNQAETQMLAEKFFEDTQKILEKQNEIRELEDQMTKIMKSTAKGEQSKIEVIDFEDILLLKQISDDIEDKQAALKKPVDDLYCAIFPGNIFVIQYLYDTWIRVKPDYQIKFGDRLESIEIKTKDELN